MAELDVWLFGRTAGRLSENADGKLTFAYSPAWVDASLPPLSQRLPLQREAFGDACWGSRQDAGRGSWRRDRDHRWPRPEHSHPQGPDRPLRRHRATSSDPRAGGRARTESRGRTSQRSFADVT
ncbi:MAG: HipA N-terminal domain-containing protein [Thermoleophilaceae bacterium]